MSTIYIGFCVMECAFVATFVRVCKKVNHFLFLIRFSSRHRLLRALVLYSSVIFLPLPFLEEILRHIQQLIKKFDIALCFNLLTSHFHWSSPTLGLAIFTCQARDSVTQPGHHAPKLWEVEKWRQKCVLAAGFADQPPYNGITTYVCAQNADCYFFIFFLLLFKIPEWNLSNNSYEERA